MNLHKKICIIFFSSKVYKNIINPVNLNIIPTWSAGACAISHLKTWLKIMETNYNVAIICEDDIIIKNANILKFYIIEAYVNIKKKESSLWFFNSIPKYNYLNKYFSEQNFYNNYSTYQINNFLNLTEENMCLIKSHFYKIDRNSLSIMINNYYPIEFQIDIHISQILRKKCKIEIMYSNKDCYINQDNIQFPSTVQYFKFKNSNELWNCINKKIPEYNCQYILDFIPKINYIHYY